MCVYTDNSDSSYDCGDDRWNGVSIQGTLVRGQEREREALLIFFYPEKKAQVESLTQVPFLPYFLFFLLQYWAPNAGCSLNIFFITFTFILFLVYGVISISSHRTESAGLMTSAAVFAYSMYYTWSALQRCVYVELSI